MEIHIAESAGFCFGVERATKALERELGEAAGKRKVITLGRIIHNERYMEEIIRQGAIEAEPDDGAVDDIVRRCEAGEEISVVIRAHGERLELLRKLESCAAQHPNLRILDGTCPYVRKVREIARENSGEGRLFILIGAPDHPEVRGIMSCASGEKLVFRDSEELALWISTKKWVPYREKIVSVAAQTTQKVSEWKKCIEIIKKVYTNALIFDTICNVTEKRQRETRALASASDVMVVIGSTQSSNSRKLWEIAGTVCPCLYFINDKNACRDIRLSPTQKVSITAGASTPRRLIQEVYETMNEQNTENFAELLEASMKTLNTGDVVEGTVTSVSNNEIHLDLGTKTTGVITHDKATNDPQAKLADLYKVGDVIKAKVIKVSDIEGIATLDKTRVDSDSNWYKLVEASESGEILEGKITEVVKGGVIITINGVKVFIPASLTGVPKDGDLASILGTTQRVKIIEIKNGERKRAYASIRAVLREERKAREEAFWNEIEEGKEYDGEVKSLTSFGAFVDLGGVDGMIHTSELSWRRIRHPSEVVSIGEKVHVYVKSFDREKGRISLGYKTEESNPWTIFTNQYAQGDTAEVKIVSLMPFGAFAEIVPGCDGLIHISQIADHKIAKPEDVLTVGQVVKAKVTAIDEENHKISLSIRALLEEEAEDEAEAEAAEEETDAE